MRYIKLVGLVLLLYSCSKDETSPESTLYYPPLSSDVWESVTPASLGWNTSLIPDLLTLLEANGTRAFIVLKDGKIVIEEYFGETITGTTSFTKSSVWYWASAGKTLTAFTAGMAQEEGYLNINNKSSDYLGTGWSSLTSAKESLITVKHHLTMTTGLDDGVADNHSFLKQDLIFKSDAGTRWAYHNAPYTLLEQVVKNAVGREFDDYFNEILRNRIGMDGSWIWTGNDHVFYSTARSMARFGILILGKGQWGGTAILSDSEFFTQMITPSQTLNKSYGYLWWLNGKESFMLPESQIVFAGTPSPNAPADMLSGLGKNGQYLSIVPSQNIVVIRMGEDPSNALVPFMFLDDIWAKLKLIIK